MNRYWVIQLDTKLFCPQSAFAYFLTSLGMEFCFTWCVGGGLVTFRHRDSICRPRWFSVRAEQLTSAVRRQRPRNVWAGWQLPSSAQWRQRKYSPRRIAVQIEWGRVCRACRMIPAPSTEAPGGSFLSLLCYQKNSGGCALFRSMVGHFLNKMAKKYFSLLTHLITPSTFWGE